jgi:YfiH family protein
MSSSNPIVPPVNPPAAPHVLTAWDIPGLVHGFCGRTGGVSMGPFATFNLAGWVGDAPDSVAENWRRWHLLHPRLPVVRVRQVHGNLVHRIDSSQIDSVRFNASRIDSSRIDSAQVDSAPRDSRPEGDARSAGQRSEVGRLEADGPASHVPQRGGTRGDVPAGYGLAHVGPAALDHAGDGRAAVGHAAVGSPIVDPEGDGMVTAAAGLALGIFTADCVPLLMVDAERRIVSALHAGWRGTLAGIAAEGIHAMVALGAQPASIRAALGPSIGLCCFEVDAALAETFAREIPGAAAQSRFGGSPPRETPAVGTNARPGIPGKAYLDLRAILRLQLEREGLNPATVANVGPCTRCANDRYFSRRGAGGTISGLQMSFIAFAP